MKPDELKHKQSFLTRDAYATHMHSTVYAIARCLSVCLSVSLSVTSRFSIETAERIQLVFCTQVTIGMSCIVLQGNLNNSKNNGISLRNLVPDSELS